MIPIAGSAYTYGYATLGEFVAWIIGWDLILEYAVRAPSTVAVGWSGYMVSLPQGLGINIPPQYTVGPLTRTPRRPTAGLNVWRLFTDGWCETGARAQRAGDVHRGADHDPAGHRHQGVGASFNNVDRRHQADGGPAFIAFGIALHQPRQLGAFMPPTTGPGSSAGRRSCAGRGGDLLRLHRLRRGVHRGPGGQESAARHADRHPRLAAICTVLYITVAARADRHRQVHPAQRARSDRGRHRRSRSGPGLAPPDRQDRRDRRPLVGDPGDAARPAADLLHDVAGRAAAADLRRGAPEVPHPVHRDAC